MALMDITVIPLGSSEGGLSGFVASLQELLAASGCSYRLHDMGTIVEGPASKLFEIAEKLHEHAFREGGKRVYTVLKIDDRRDRDVRIGDKSASVEAKIVSSAAERK
ncbi:MAG: MTH1187 family thiamine-binding protein [Chlorobiaceae bacterium]|nr:MTH1187 family thiamine-binding protein [Chlorobiaceae bacterium]NTV60121.1 MTH1187 family thiamine-binding protein [Chlorobiaceae bacterium]